MLILKLSDRQLISNTNYQLPKNECQKYLMCKSKRNLFEQHLTIEWSPEILTSVTALRLVDKNN